MISFDTNILVYATASVPDVKALRARDLIGRAMRAGWTILLLQTLAEFANVAIRKAGIPIEDIRRTIDAWRAVFPIQAADDDDLQSVRFVNPFKRANDRLIDEVLPPEAARR
jgi:predicted nucleic acid-binding protein